MDNSYRPLNSVAQILPIPLMLIHSKQDEIISFEHAQTLYDAVVQPKIVKVLTDSRNVIFNKTENR